MNSVAERPSRAERLAERLSRWTKAPPRLVVYAAIAIAATLGCLAARPFVRAHLQAMAVLREVAGQPVPRPVARFILAPVTRQELTIPGSAGAVRARLYRPTGAAREPRLVIFHGVHHLGIDEPRLVSFAAAMASCGIEVLTPELPDIKDYHVGASSVRTIGESARWFATRPRGTSASVGVMGLSFAGGLALIAAADPLYHPYIRFVFAVGSQDSMDRVTRYYRTGTDTRPDGTLERLAAHEYGPLVLEYEYLDDLLPASDVPAVRAVLQAHLYEDKTAETAASLRLSDVERRETLALMDSTSEETRARIAAVLARHAAELNDVSPSGRLRGIATPVYLLHGEADNIIPSAETLWMASELLPEDLKAVLVSPVLSHLDLDGPGPGATDQWRLLHFFALVLDATERGASR